MTRQTRERERERARESCDADLSWPSWRCFHQGEHVTSETRTDDFLHITHTQHSTAPTPPVHTAYSHTLLPCHKLKYTNVAGWNYSGSYAAETSFYSQIIHNWWSKPHAPVQLLISTVPVPVLKIHFSMSTKITCDKVTKRTHSQFWNKWRRRVKRQLANTSSPVNNRW